MEKKTQSKKRVHKKGFSSEPLNAFYEYLERLGLYDDGQPSSYMRPIYCADRTTRVGWWHVIEGIGREGIGCNEGPFWSALEIVLPKKGLLIAAFSFNYDDPSEPSDDYYIHDVVWKQTAQNIRRKPLFEGASKTWRKYSCGRVADAIRNGIEERPWLTLTFADEAYSNLAFDDDKVFSYLEYITKPVKTNPKDKKPYRRILEAIYALDPDALEHVTLRSGAL